MFSNVAWLGCTLRATSSQTVRVWSMRVLASSINDNGVASKAGGNCERELDKILMFPIVEMSERYSLATDRS